MILKFELCEGSLFFLFFFEVNYCAFKDVRDVYITMHLTLDHVSMRSNWMNDLIVHIFRKLLA